MDWELAEKLRIQEQLRIAEMERRREAERSIVRAEISSCETQREVISQEIQSLTTKVELQEGARTKFRQLWANYEEGRCSYATKLERVVAHREFVKMIPGHENMIRDRVQGNLAEQAVYCMESIEQKMVSEITKNLDCIEDLQWQLRELNQRINDLYERLWRI